MDPPEYSLTCADSRRYPPPGHSLGSTEQHACRRWHGESPLRAVHVSPYVPRDESSEMVAERVPGAQIGKSGLKVVVDYRSAKDAAQAWFLP